MTFINPIMSYSQGIYGGIKTAKREEITADKKESTHKEEIATTTHQKKQVSADEIFQYMSSSYAQVKPSKEVKVSAYVSSESQDRIQRTVNQFNSLFNKTLNIIRNEFGDILSDDAMNTLTLQLLT